MNSYHIYLSSKAKTRIDIDGVAYSFTYKVKSVDLVIIYMYRYEQLVVSKELSTLDNCIKMFRGHIILDTKCFVQSVQTVA